jgi:nicotinate-nucleotide adenylyltransferase
VGLFGGTFNPPHLGHLIVAEEVRQTFSLDIIVFVPSARPPHKESSPVIDPRHRFTMTRLAIENNPRFEISDVELKRRGKSYTIDTIKEFKTLYGADIELFFIMGGDSIFEIETWKKPEELFRLCRVIVTTRPGFDLAKIDDRFGDKIIRADVPRIDISSTDIRHRVGTGRSITYLVPDKVEEYIQRERLYRFCDPA